jgi:hypothetical protein
MQQAAMALIDEHNNNQKHNARLVKYRYVEYSNPEAEQEMLRKEKIAILKGILSLR